MQTDVRVKKIEQYNDRTLEIVWTDDVVSHYDVVELRRNCPCAACIDEWTHERRLKPENVAESVRPVRVDSVGRYALQIRYSDGHSTGIYTFKHLRDMVADKNHAGCTH